MFDYHLHSDFSADCSTPMEKTIEQAIKLGLSEICFTEHIDYDFPDPRIQFELDLEKYNKKIKEMQITYEGRIEIKKGVEFGVQPHVLTRYEKLLEKEEFDFIICSMHATNKQELHFGTFFADKTVEEAYKMYYEELLYCVKNFDQYSVLGHVDLVKRYTKKDSNNNYHEIIREIFAEIIPKGKGIELNTSGFKYGLNSGMPSVDILKLYKECGGEVLTLGSDSHKASEVANHFSSSVELLKSIGFKYITTFSDRTPTFHSLKDI